MWWGRRGRRKLKSSQIYITLVFGYNMKGVVLFVLVVFSLVSVGAVSTTLGDSFAPRETMIGQFSSNVLEISGDDVRVLKDGHIDVGFNGDIQRIGEDYFVWLPAPQNPGNYSLVVANVVATEGGFPALIDYEKEFVVEGEQTDYAISPGFVLSSDDFEIGATLYEDFSKEISVDYPASGNITLNPGANTIDFEIGDFVGNQFVTINIGKYQMPAYLIGQASVCGDGEIDGEEVCDSVNFGTESCVGQGFDLGDLVCASDCLSFSNESCEMADEEIVCGSNHLDLCLDEGN